MVLLTQGKTQAEWSSTGWQSGAFGSGSVLDGLCDLGLVPAFSGPRVLSRTVTALCFVLQTPSLTLQGRQGRSRVLP